MKNRSELERLVAKGADIIEVGPYHSGLFKKADGYKTVVFDVFSKEQLLENAIRDHVITREMLDRVEDVDVIASAVNIGAAVSAKYPGRLFDCVVSCHNLEHIPDPIRFFQGCRSLLKKDGCVLLALPDLRTCYDFFRPVTIVGAWIGAFLEKRERPTPQQVFDHRSFHSTLNDQPAWLPGCVLHAIEPLSTVKQAYELWTETIRTADASYKDCHCWVFTPASFQLIMLDCRYLGLIPFEIEKISAAQSGEILAIVAPAEPFGLDDNFFYIQRKKLMIEIKRELAEHIN